MSVDLTVAALESIKAVVPTLQQLAANPLRAWSLYTSVDSLTSGIIISLAIGVACYIAQLTSGNCSWVDRLWSLVPWGYVVHFAAHPILAGGPVNARAALMAALTVAWGVRLTYNFWRKGGYDVHGEDYRWPELRRIITNRVAWEAFSLLFIALYQNVLLLAFASPAWAVTRIAPVSSFDKLTPGDWAVAGLWTALLLWETVSDQQQWNFQTAKYALINAKKSISGTPFEKGFVTTGLWRYSRHPNFFSEISLWWTFYLFTITASAAVSSPVFLNVTIIGAILLNLLFLGSTSFTEQITAAKYPAYVEYQRTTSRLVPWFSSASAKAARD